MVGEKEPQASWEKYTSSHGIPDAVVIDVTNVCNCAGCAHCYIDAVKPGDKRGTGVYMDLVTPDVWTDVFTFNGSPRQIWISGGEPTIHPKLDLIINKFKQHGFYIALITNGERLADNNYCKQLTSLNLDEVAVTVRGMGGLHDLLMLPADDPLWGTISQEQPITEQINVATAKIGSAKHFEETIQGLVNLSKTGVKIALNIDMQVSVDMVGIVDHITDRGGRVDTIYLQVQQETGRAKDQPLAIPNRWREPTEEMVIEYLNQAYTLLGRKTVQEVIVIDPLPPEIVNNLDLINKEIYQPRAVPAISPAGLLRDDVLNVDRLGV